AFRDFEVGVFEGDIADKGVGAGEELERRDENADEIDFVSESRSAVNDDEFIESEDGNLGVQHGVSEISQGIGSVHLNGKELDRRVGGEGNDGSAVEGKGIGAGGAGCEDDCSEKAERCE